MAGKTDEAGAKGGAARENRGGKNANIAASPVSTAPLHLQTNRFRLAGSAQPRWEKSFFDRGSRRPEAVHSREEKR